MNIYVGSLNFKMNEGQLKELFEEYGEEKNARKIAAKIVSERKTKAIETTKELENIVFHCLSAAKNSSRSNYFSKKFYPRLSRIFCKDISSFFISSCSIF